MIIGSLEELRRHERELVDQINATHNGGARFLAHPLRMLSDLRVELSEEAIRELNSLEPRATVGSDVAYEALLAQGESTVQVRLTEGLFRPA
jgi:hypothetical protein